MTNAARDLLRLDDLCGDDLLAILSRAQLLATDWAGRKMPQSLARRRVALAVGDDGWRNTTAFDLGVQAMGGICVHAPIRLGGEETTPDLATYLDNWVDAIVCRTQEIADLEALAEAADAPVINARTRWNHPCETLGDLAYHMQQHGELGGIDHGIKVAAVAPDANILRSWIEIAAVLPIEVVQVYPAPWQVKHMRPGHDRFQVATALDEVLDADIVITDCWPADADAEALSDYRVTAAVLDRLPAKTSFIPCPPVTRGQEVSASAMEHPACRAVTAKAFLLHAQNAALEWVFGLI